MKNRWIVYLVVSLLSLAIVACQSTPVLQTPDDAASQPSVQKVVALTSLSADIVYRLDSTKLVGIPGSKLTSADRRFKDLPTVSADRTPPNLEAIVALEPDLVIGADGFHDQALAKLKQLGISTLMTHLDSWTALEKLTEDLARSLNADPKALLDRYQSFLADRPTQTPTTLVLASLQPIQAPNQASWAGSLLTQFNVKNLAAQLQGNSPIRGYVTLSPEKILASNPEAIILVDLGEDILSQFKANAFWQKLQAVQRDRLYVFDYYGFVNPGSIDRIEKACTQLKQIFSTPAS
jgi:iron complex transport system substrate-binding protein